MPGAAKIGLRLNRLRKMASRANDLVDAGKVIGKADDVVDATRRAQTLADDADDVVKNAANARRAHKGGLLWDAPELKGFILERKRGIYEVIAHGSVLLKVGVDEIARAVREFAGKNAIRRVNLIACQTAGKSKLAQRLAKKMGVPVVGATQNTGVIGPLGEFVGWGHRGIGRVDWGALKGRWRVHRKGHL